MGVQQYNEHDLLLLLHLRDFAKFKISFSFRSLGICIPALEMLPLVFRNVHQRGIYRQTLKGKSVCFLRNKSKHKYRMVPGLIGFYGKINMRMFSQKFDQQHI